MSTDRVKSLRDKHSDETRRSILRAARRAFAHVGFAETSIDQLAEDARVTKGAVYHHFSNKQALFRAVYEELAAEVEARVRERITQREDPLDRARVGIEAFLACADDVAVRTIMFRDGMPVLLGECRAIDDRYYLRLLRELLDDLARSDLLVDVDTGVLARLLLSLLIEGSQMLGQADDIDASRALLRVALERIVFGLLRMPQ